MNELVRSGFGDKEHPNYYKAFLKGDSAERAIKAGLKKGSLIQIAGDLDITSYNKKDGTIGVSNNIDVFGWSYVSSGKAKTDENKEVNQSKAVNGYTSASYQNPTIGNITPNFEELEDDDELPF